MNPLCVCGHTVMVHTDSPGTPCLRVSCDCRHFREVEEVHEASDTAETLLGDWESLLTRIHESKLSARDVRHLLGEIQADVQHEIARGDQ